MEPIAAEPFLSKSRKQECCSGARNKTGKVFHLIPTLLPLPPLLYPLPFPGCWCRESVAGNTSFLLLLLLFPPVRNGLQKCYAPLLPLFLNGESIDIINQFFFSKKVRTYIIHFLTHVASSFSFFLKSFAPNECITFVLSAHWREQQHFYLCAIITLGRGRGRLKARRQVSEEEKAEGSNYYSLSGNPLPKFLSHNRNLVRGVKGERERDLDKNFLPEGRRRRRTRQTDRGERARPSPPPPTNYDSPLSIACCCFRIFFHHTFCFTEGTYRRRQISANCFLGFDRSGWWWLTRRNFFFFISSLTRGAEYFCITIIKCGSEWRGVHMQWSQSRKRKEEVEFVVGMRMLLRLSARQRKKKYWMKLFSSPYYFSLLGCCVKFTWSLKQMADFKEHFSKEKEEKEAFVVY